MNIHRFLRRVAASQYLNENWGVPCAPATLAKYAVIGGGPTFQRAGRVPVYTPQNLDAWARSKLSAPMKSTSDAAPPERSTIDCCEQSELIGDHQNHNDGDDDDGDGDGENETRSGTDAGSLGQCGRTN
jgi:hypothetical protein